MQAGKAGSFTYEPKPKEMVETAKKQMEAEAAAKKEAEAYVAAVKAALASKGKTDGAPAWLEGPYAHRIKAVRVGQWVADGQGDRMWIICHQLPAKAFHIPSLGAIMA